MKVAKGMRVQLRAKLEVDGGQVLEDSVVEYFHGAGAMLPGLESALEGLGAGEKKSGVIEAPDAFGSASHEVVNKIHKSEFPTDATLAAGAEFTAKGENGQDVILQVVRVTEDDIHVRLRHPLADKDIRYAVEILAVTDPSPPPLPAEAVAKEAD